MNNKLIHEYLDMKTKIIFATGNANKMREIKEILGEDADIERDAAQEGSAITMILFRQPKKK